MPAEALIFQGNLTGTAYELVRETLRIKTETATTVAESPARASTGQKTQGIARAFRPIQVPTRRQVESSAQHQSRH